MILDHNGNPITTQNKRPDTREIAVATVRDKYSSYPSSGLTPERLARVLKEADQGDIYRQAELFEEIEEKDPHLFSVMQTRKNTVLGLDWEIIAYSDDERDQEIAKFVGNILYNLQDFEDAILDLLDAIGKGFSVSEIMWAIEDGAAVPIHLKWRHQKKFRYDQLDNLRLLTEENLSTGIEIPPNKFIIHQYKARSGSPARAGVYRVCVWMYLFKNFTVKDWVAFAEVYGMPIRLGKYEPGTSQEEKNALLQAVLQIASDAAGIISKNTEVEFIQAIKQDGDVFKNLAQFCNTEISKAVLGQTMSSDIGDSGSYAASKTHAEVRQDILESDCKGVSKTIRRDLIRPLVLFNYGDDKRLPYLKFHYEKPEDQEKEATKYKTLAEIGLPLATEHLYEKFGIPKPETGQELLAPLMQGGNLFPSKASLQVFKKPPDMVSSQRTIDDLADQLLVNGAPIIEKLLSPYMAAIQDANDPEELKERLLAIYAKLDTTELQELLAEGMYVADLFGRWSAHE
ncbi:DUF935 domain-containing protein [Propionispora vibrioides]|uniref:Mu-like prophage protein gp29 n=1 Tax=Propionispora vibrioides TaxID=112903 RepID=A0A1H8U4X1_9FIRM|nr:DUF935 domain-containing protein [Propionispora vibrioides]SEO98221.1 Mu-like prophage protein gp29 [Propionispora vibrioides]